MLTRIGQLLKIEWIHEMPVPPVQRSFTLAGPDTIELPEDDLRELRSLVQIGHARAVQEKLSAIELAHTRNFKHSLPNSGHT